MVPSYRFQNVVKDDVSIERLKYGNVSYRFAFTRLLARNVEISLGYDYSRINCISTGNTFLQRDTFYYSLTNFGIQKYNQVILDDPKLTYNGGTIGFNFYRLGSLAPVGKFIGFSFSYGIAKMKENEAVLVGKRMIPDKENFFRTIGAIADIDTVNITEKINVKSFHFKARIGRNYPITDNIMLSVGMSFPIISYYSNGTTQKIGGTLNKNGYSLSENKSWVLYSMTSIKRYNRIMLEAAIRFHF